MAGRSAFATLRFAKTLSDAYGIGCAELAELERKDMKKGALRLAKRPQCY